MVGGMTPSRMAPMAVRALITPAAPRRWPTIDLGELMCTRRAWSPKAPLMARVSVTSLSGVLGPVRHDVVDFVGRDARIAHGLGHGACRAPPGRLGRRDVEGVGGQRRADDLGLDGRPARQGVLGRLEHHGARALAVTEAVAVAIERP